MNMEKVIDDYSVDGDENHDDDDDIYNNDSTVIQIMSKIKE